MFHILLPLIGRFAALTPEPPHRSAQPLPDRCLFRTFQNDNSRRKTPIEQQPQSFDNRSRLLSQQSRFIGDFRHIRTGHRSGTFQFDRRPLRYHVGGRSAPLFRRAVDEILAGRRQLFVQPFGGITFAMRCVRFRGIAVRILLMLLLLLRLRLVFGARRSRPANAARTTCCCLAVDGQNAAGNGVRRCGRTGCDHRAVDETTCGQHSYDYALWIEYWWAIDDDGICERNVVTGNLCLLLCVSVCGFVCVSVCLL